jgi:peptidoglycan/LPS O-acetylase OafA/YrhL
MAKQRPFPGSLSSALQLKQLPALDGLRAIAAFLVVFYHSASPLIPGGLGVLAFFVLSGFLITWLLLEEHDRYGAVSLRLFYARRTLRIFPAFYAYWFLLAAYTAWRGVIHWPQAISSFFYVNNYYQAIFGDPNTAFSHTWSLGIEEQFYLFWPALFIALQRTSRENALRVLLRSIVVVWVYRWILQFVVQVNQGYIYEAFDARVDHLLCGCALAFALRTGAFSRLWNRLGSTVWFSLATLGALIVSVALANRYGADYRNAIGFVVDPVLIALLIPQLMMQRASPAWSWLSWSWVRYLGRISYSVYLYQQITPSFAGRVFAEGSAAFVVLNAALVVAAATGSYYVVERPFLRLKNRFARIQHAPA